MPTALVRSIRSIWTLSVLPLIISPFGLRLWSVWTMWTDRTACRDRKASVERCRRDGRRALWYYCRLTNKGWRPIRIEIRYCGQ